MFCSMTDSSGKSRRRHILFSIISKGKAGAEHSYSRSYLAEQGDNNVWLLVPKETQEFQILCMATKDLKCGISWM